MSAKFTAVKRLIFICLILGLFSTCKKDDLIYTTKNVTVVEPGPPFDSTFALSVYPNPFNGFINFDYTLADSRDVEWLVLDLTGRIIRGEFRSAQVVGYHHVNADLGSLNTGMYFLVFRFGSIEKIRKVIKT